MVRCIAGTATHPEELIVTGNAGDVCVFNAHIWHAGTANEGDTMRRGVLAYMYFARREAYYGGWLNLDGTPNKNTPQNDHEASLGELERAQLSEVALALASVGLGGCWMRDPSVAAAAL
jgi:ectoine hydroxylase-related dioxygenase (phytanoyl-CoA dioxygenase family)